MDKIHAIRALAGHRIRLRPLQRALSRLGKTAEGIDDQWTVVSATDQFFKLENARTGHVVGLTYDHVQGPPEGGVLVLRTRFTLEGENITIEPLTTPSSGQ